MNPTSLSNPDRKRRALYALTVCHILVLVFFVVNVIYYKASLLDFWLPALAFIILYGYISADDYKKFHIRAITKEKISLKNGVVVLLLLIFVFVTKNWKASTLNFSDAFLLTILFGNIKDYIVDVLEMRKFASSPDQQ